MNRDPSSKVLDTFNVEWKLNVFGRQVVRAELIEHVPGTEYPSHRYWAIKIWRSHVDQPEAQFPSQVHVGQEKYIRRLWVGYKKRNGV